MWIAAGSRAGKNASQPRRQGPQAAGMLGQAIPAAVVFDSALDLFAKKEQLTLPSWRYASLFCSTCEAEYFDGATPEPKLRLFGFMVLDSQTLPPNPERKDCERRLQICAAPTPLSRADAGRPCPFERLLLQLSLRGSKAARLWPRRRSGAPRAAAHYFGGTGSARVRRRFAPRPRAPSSPRPTKLLRGFC